MAPRELRHWPPVDVSGPMYQCAEGVWIGRNISGDFMPSCALLTQAMLALVQDAARVAASAMVTAGSSELEVEKCELNGRRGSQGHHEVIERWLSVLDAASRTRCREETSHV